MRFFLPFLKTNLDSGLCSWFVRIMPGSPLPADLPDRPDPPQDRPAQDRPAASTDQPSTGQPGCTARLLGMVRRLIDYGRKLAGTLHNNPAALEPAVIQHKFGTADMKLILRRITRGILLAVALQAKLVARLECPERTPARTSDPAPDAAPRLRPKRAARPNPDARRAAADAALLVRLPSAKEIAAQMRYRPIGAVILDIFRSLGILPGESDGIWHEASADIVTSGGDVAGLFNEIGKRQHKWFVERHGRNTPFDCADLTWAVEKLHGTGPP
jgi:hypothetical protein